MPQTFFYDNQMRRFLLQFIRAFSNFQVEYGKDRDGQTTLLTVPVKYGDATRLVSNIIRDNSENKQIPSPMMSVYITAMEYARDRMQEPTFVDKKHISIQIYINILYKHMYRKSESGIKPYTLYTYIYIYIYEYMYI